MSGLGKVVCILSHVQYHPLWFRPWGRKLLWVRVPPFHSCKVEISLGAGSSVSPSFLIKLAQLAFNFSNIKAQHSFSFSTKRIFCSVYPYSLLAPDGRFSKNKWGRGYLYLAFSRDLYVLLYLSLPRNKSGENSWTLNSAPPFEPLTLSKLWRYCDIVLRL